MHYTTQFGVTNSKILILEIEKEGSIMVFENQWKKSHWALKICGQIVSPERSLLIGQQLVENVKIEKLKWDILDDFQTV